MQISSFNCVLKFLMKEKITLKLQVKNMLKQR